MENVQFNVNIEILQIAELTQKRNHCKVRQKRMQLTSTNNNHASC